jgi:hypothetical protein
MLISFLQSAQCGYSGFADGLNCEIIDYISV